MATSVAAAPSPLESLQYGIRHCATVGTLETSILQFTRTVFAMGRDNVLPKRYAQLHQTYRTPWLATLLITVLGLLLLLLSSRLSGIKTVIGDSINALSFQIAFYYGLAGLACGWHFRKQALSGLSQFILLFAWPLIGVGFCLYIAVYNLSTYDSITNLIGVGGIAIGILPYLRIRQLGG